ncbi:DUF3575 domain-containing protein [Pontibacter liquoris]|uniref:DUF3575 domain-containing protein n=1 Tax=Pontibacter liquoris TaxID=2905677 RepID=UPI001FA6FAEC|nr:DUF3575 domain-containing protein [Pontibacter liquoris]
MKRIILFCAAALLLTAAPLSSSIAQGQAPTRSTVIKVNVLSPFAATGSGFIEHAFGPHISGQVGAFITGVSVSGVRFDGYGFTPEVRYYVSDYKAAPAGLYLAGYGRILNYKLTVQDKDQGKEYKATYAPIGAGIAAGNQFIFNNGISVDIFLGAGINGGSLKVNSGTEEDFDTGFLNLLGSGFRLRPGLTVGYSF